MGMKSRISRFPNIIVLKKPPCWKSIQVILGSFLSGGGVKKKMDVELTSIKCHLCSVSCIIAGELLLSIGTQVSFLLKHILLKKMFIFRYHTWVWTGRKPENEIYRPIGSESRVSYHMVISLKKVHTKAFFKLSRSNSVI